MSNDRTLDLVIDTLKAWRKECAVLEELSVVRGPIGDSGAGSARLSVSVQFPQGYGPSTFSNKESK